MSIRSRLRARIVRTAAAIAAAVALPFSAPPAGAALSEQGGTGVWEVQSAESARPARLELGFFSTYQRLGLRDSADSQINELIGGATAAFGLPGGFELSGSLPFYNPYTTFGGGTTPDGDELSPKLGDLTARMRWSGPFIAPGLRWGFEGSARFATGNNDESAYPGRASTQAFTARENSYSGRALMTWDGLRAGTGVPLRLHGNGGYTIQGDDTRYILPMTPLPLEVPAPVRNRDNDFLTLGAAAEIDLSRVTLFGEVVTDQFVNERSFMKGKESRVVVTPGFRFWLPGGVSFGGAYSFNISDDDPATAFDPGRAFPKSQWRAAFSLGTVYRGASAKAEDLIAADGPVVPVTRTAAAPAPAPRAAAEVTRASDGDSASAAKAEREREILTRRGVQEDPPRTAEARPAPAAAAAGTPRAAARPAPAHALLDSDGDGIPDASDACPLQAEDWDGFQDRDGCPDLDNDQDGILDIRDQCPNDPETYNGYYDFDGCPDETRSRWIGPSGSLEPEADPAAQDPAAAVTAPPADTVALARRPAPAAPARAGAALAPPAGASAPAALAARPAANDTLRAALEAERMRARLLEERAARAEAERTLLIERLTAQRPAAAPVSDSALARADAEELRRMILADRARSAEAAQRLQTLETRQELLRERPAAATPQAPGGATTVVTPSSGANADLAARIAVLESRMARDAAHDAGRSAALDAGANAAPAPQPATAAPETVVVTAPPDGPSPAVIERLNAIENAVAALDRDDRANATRAIDTLLPVGVRRVFPEIVFSTRSAGVSAPGAARIGEIAAALREAPDAMVRVVGHTDDRGAAGVNLQLSQQRAATVADMLFAQGVARGQLVVDGRGEAEPVDTNATAAGRSMNRRVEFIRIR